MAKSNLNALLIELEAEALPLLKTAFANRGLQVSTVSSYGAAVQAIKGQEFKLIVAQHSANARSGLKIIEDCSIFAGEVPPMLFLTHGADPDLADSANKVTSSDIISVRSTPEEFATSIDKMLKRADDKILDLMETIRSISGITLGSDKRPLVETRLLRRMRQLGLQSYEEYFSYFKENRDVEVTELVSLITTHTTHFFRESGHFDYLNDVLFPQLVKSGQKEIRIWSAASSTGEEIYSLGICWLEFLRNQSIAPTSAPKFTILGTDIDQNVVQAAKKGIYPKQNVERIQTELAKRYFDFGSGELAGLVRVKNEVHRLCEFKTLNLMGKKFPSEKFDAIFLRNVLIYFKTDSVKQIVLGLESCLKENGLLFLGHSESLTGMNMPLEVVGNSIYQTKRGQKTKAILKPNTPLVINSNNPSTMDLQRKIRVFIMDDSQTIRGMLRALFKQDPSFEVVGEAEHPKALKSPLDPKDIDVLTLDIHMPEQDGISYLRSIQGKPHPSVVMVSSVSYEDGVDYMNCLELGAVDYIEKPNGQNLMAEAERIRQVIRAAAQKKKNSSFGMIKNSARIGDTAVYTPSPGSKDLILIGASTGGVEAIKVVLECFPAECPPVVIVQHIPPVFSRTFAERLSHVCPMKVTEAQHNEVLEKNHAYIAPGGKQMALEEQGSQVRIVLSDGEPVNRHKPSVDFMFDSALRLVKRHHITAAILTGMGNDGAKGLLALKNAGVHTVAQNEETCVVFGMPKVAIELNAATEVIPLQSVAYHLFKALKAKSRNAA